MKEIKINIPEGYEIDKENSTFEVIKFKKIEIKKYWENLPIIEGYYIDSCSGITYLKDESIDKTSKNTYPTRALAKSALAYAQITQLIHHFYGGLVKIEDYKSGNPKYNILYKAGGFLTDSFTFLYSPITFHKQEDRDAFMKDHEDLLKQYFMID